MKDILFTSVGKNFILFLLLMFPTTSVLAENLDNDDSSDNRSFLMNMPKAELHIHLEGSLDPETVSRLAKDNQLSFFKTADEVRFSLDNRSPGLNGFLSHYNKAIQVFRTEEGFYNATLSLLKTLKQNNIVYVDLFFDPQAHTDRNIPFETFFAGIDRGRIAAEEMFGIQVNLIMCFNRNLSASSALEMLNQAKPFKQRIVGLGMDSGPEYGNPPVKFQEVYSKAREEGYYLTGHHDVHVQDSVKHIWQSINIIKLDRIDHGLDAVQDPKLMAALRQRNICLTGSPVKRSSDLVPQDIDAIRILDDNGVCVSIHSDDPGQFASGYLTNMMILVQSAGNFSKADMTRLMLNAFKAIWLPEDEKLIYINQLKTYAQNNLVDWNEVVRAKRD